MLYYHEAERRERRLRAQSIIDHNAAFVGGRAATDLVRQLGRD